MLQKEQRIFVFLWGRFVGPICFVISCKNTSLLLTPSFQGIAGTVAATGETINIADAYADPRFSSRFLFIDFC